MRVSEIQLEQLAEESGGSIWLPQTFEVMIDDGTARLIDSRYMVTYQPKGTLLSAREGEIRRNRCRFAKSRIARGSRRQYVVPVIPPNDGRARKVMN